MIALAYPRVEKPADGPARLKRLPRIRVAQIAADHVGNGWSAEESIRQYPHLTEAEVHAALGYYFDHRDEIEAELTAELAHTEADRAPSPLRRKLLALRSGARS